jgi:hypothetical protein
MGDKAEARDVDCPVSRFVDDTEEFKYLSETVSCLWEAQVKDPNDPFTAEKLVSLYAKRTTQMRDMKASKMGTVETMETPWQR